MFYFGSFVGSSASGQKHQIGPQSFSKYKSDEGVRGISLP